jgi:biotin transporter BioY
MTTAHLSFRAAFAAAVLPFLPGEAIKVLVASGLYSAGRRRS